MGKASNLPLPAPISEKKEPWTAVQVTVSKRLMLRSKNQLSVCAGKVASKLAQKGLTASVCLMVVSSIKRV